MDNEPSSPMMDFVPDSMDDGSSSPPMDVVPDSMDDEPSSPPMADVPDSFDDEPQKDIAPDSMDDEPIDVVSDATDNEPQFPSMFVIPDDTDDEGEENVEPNDYDIPRNRKKEKRIMNQLNKPSCIQALGQNGKLCNQNRDRLWVLLNKLMRRRNWADASGVLAVLLQATSNERSLHHNHIKYSGAKEILAHIESGSAYSKDADDIYNIWLKKNAPRKNKPLKDKFVLFDAIISFLVEKNYDGARSAAICLMQDRGAENDPISNLILGLCHYELWYTTLPKHRQLVDIHQQDTRDQMDYNSDEMSGSQGYPKETNTGLPDSLLFPIRWDPLSENIEDVLKELRRNYYYDYDDAVNYLRKALNSTPGVLEALIPLVQILLLNDRVAEAFDELDRFSCASNVLFATRLKTHWFECLGCNNVEQLCSSYEDILNKDPTCKHSVKKLIWLCQMGDYSPERLVEMIGLHLDAAFAEHDIWKEFASCLLKVCESKEDRTWNLRRRWWKNRHLNKKSLESEMAGGKLSLMAYKAACATQIYGPGFSYVVKVGDFMKEEDVALFMVLDKYLQSNKSTS